MIRPLHRPARVAAALLACVLAAVEGVEASPSGVLDPEFGSGGRTSTGVGSIDDFGLAMALGADGRVVVAGYSTSGTSPDDMSLARFDMNGALDTTLNGTGKEIVSFGADVDRAHAVAISPTDQKIVLAGFQRTGGKDDFAVVRLKPNGALDTSFNSTGKVVIGLSTGADAASAVAVQPDGKVVVAGYAISTNRDVAVARLQSNGTLDTSFNSTGKNVFGVGTGNDEALAITLQPDGKTLVAGQAADGSQIDMMVARLGTDGTLDADFGSGGKVRIAFGIGNEYATGIALQPDGKILVGGYARIGTTYDFALARLLANGTLDPTFDGDGLVTTEIGTSAQANSVAFADGHIVLGGTAKVNGSDDFALARYGIDGALDTFFGTGGIVTTGFDGAADSGRSVALQQDRKIVLGGGTRASNDDNFAVTRWLVDDCGNGALDPGEECDGSMGENGDCCSACRLVAAGTTCRPVGDRCDLAEACGGLDGDCPADARKPDSDEDGICNEFDLCPQESDPDQADHDADGLGDACDPCTNGTDASKPKLKITNYATSPGDDKFNLDGTIDFAEPILLAPDLHGLRVVVTAGDGSVLGDVLLPGGSAWKPNRAGTSWSWRSPTLVGGWINSARLRTSPSRPDQVGFSVAGSRGAFATPRPALPLEAIVVLDAPTAATGLCGFARFPATGPPAPHCTLGPTGSTIDCR